MTLAIVESWSFEVPRLIEFVIWGIEISCFFFFFFLETITRNWKYFDEEKDIDGFEKENSQDDLFEFPYFPYRYLISSLWKHFTRKKLSRYFHEQGIPLQDLSSIFFSNLLLWARFRIYSSLNLSFPYCQTTREIICRFHFRNAIAPSETLSRNFLFNYRLL